MYLLFFYLHPSFIELLHQKGIDMPSEREVLAAYFIAESIQNDIDDELEEEERRSQEEEDEDDDDYEDSYLAWRQRKLDEKLGKTSSTVHVRTDMIQYLPEPKELVNSAINKVTGLFGFKLFK